MLSATADWVLVLGTPLCSPIEETALEVLFVREFWPCTEADAEREMEAEETDEAAGRALPSFRDFEVCDGVAEATLALRLLFPLTG